MEQVRLVEEILQGFDIPTLQSVNKSLPLDIAVKNELYINLQVWSSNF